ncbi:hypothetical protein [Candidatus Pantoea persica]|nr:hypothetical protein [Candidatus Pantoea persica]
MNNDAHSSVNIPPSIPTSKRMFRTLLNRDKTPVAVLIYAALRAAG